MQTMSVYSTVLRTVKRIGLDSNNSLKGCTFKFHLTTAWMYGVEKHYSAQLPPVIGSGTIEA